MPLTRRETFRRRRIAVFGLLAVVLATTGYLAATGLAPVPATAVALSQPSDATQPAAQPVWPGFGESAVGAVGFPGLLGSNGAQATVPMASITKMVTALVILDAKPLGETEAGPDVTFTDRDVALYYGVLAEGGSVAPVVSGMVLSQREALEAMVLPSANNYSESLAVWAYGSVDAYLAAAATWAGEQGLTSTTVADTSGISSDSVSSPTDLVALGKLVAASPALASIVAMPTADLPVIGTVTNTNKLLGSYGVDGIKTGTTIAAGACLLFSTDLTIGTQTVTVVGVVLGGQTHTQVSRSVAALIESVKAGFQEVSLTEAGAGYGTYTTPWGQTSSVVAAEPASVLVWSDTPIEGVADARPITIGDAGDAVGTVDFLVGDETISVPLELEQALTDPGPAWRFSHPGQLVARS